MASQHRRIGELLRDMGLITQAQLEEALTYHEQWRNRMRFGEALVALNFISEIDLARSLSKLYRIPFVQLSNIKIPENVLSLIPRDLVERQQVIPVRMVEVRGRRTITVAMADPYGLQDVQQLEFTTGCKIIPALATPSEITAAVTKYYREPEFEQSFTGFGMLEFLDVPTSTDSDSENDAIIPGHQVVGSELEHFGSSGDSYDLSLDDVSPQDIRVGARQGGNRLSRPPLRASNNAVDASPSPRPPNQPPPTVGLRNRTTVPPTRGPASAPPPPRERPVEIRFRKDPSASPAVDSSGGVALGRIQTLKVTNPLAAGDPVSESNLPAQVDGLKRRLDRIERNLFAIYQALTRRGLLNPDDVDFES